jgi:regulator of cell morphogenesis and NO signaling
MTTLTPERTVGEIAAALAASIRVFEKHGIDFCCGGAVSITDACRRAGIDPALLLQEIDQAAKAPTPDATDWMTAPLPALMDYILDTHHVYMKAQLPRLETMLAKVLQAHGDRHGETLRALAAVYALMKAELDAHLLKEERILFPMIRTGESHCGGVQNPIRVMLYEHDSAGDALLQMRRLTAGYTPPPDACNTFRALYHELSEMENDLHRHIHLENNILFPRALSL